ncbi:MAG: hypothetical protein U0R52_07645 [Solirubrobacterales bacterium]
MAATLALTAVGLASASPGQDAGVRSSSFELLFNNDGSSVVSCPPGSVAVGGGLGVAAGPPGVPNSAINVSGPVNASQLTSHTKSGDAARGWYASAYSGTASEVDFKTFAICSRSSAARLRVRSFAIGPGRTRTAIVSCPPHQRALGGGLGVSDGQENGVYQISSGPLAGSGGVASANTGDVARRWMVSAYNGFPAKRSFKAMVTCARTGNARIVSDKVDVNPNDSTEIAAACPPADRALGGGLSILGSPTPLLDVISDGPQGPSGTTATTMDGDLVRYWDGSVYNRAPAVRFFKVFAICASR